MHILKLPWLGHKTENKDIECYAVSVNQDGTRLASGGLDGTIKIWDTATIDSFVKMATTDTKKSKQDPTLPDKSLRRPLCSMSRHNGVVTSVKFSPDGHYLASGSDDKICLIWERDETPRKQFGVEEPDLEHWTVRKRLVAHDNDIQDICWSPDGTLLVTVGLDRSIIIWNGITFERVKRYDVHQSMVKGIVFDPANKFFATASDDRTVRIFRYYKKLNEYNNYEFQMEHIVTDPFRKSPLTSYFRRMSWSPDGQHIAVPNATNGPVPSIAIINRGNWGTDVSLIGHEAPVEVCSFSPRLFQIDKKEDSFQTILATGGQDRTLAVWSTCNSRPLLVAQDIVDSSITDICWAPSGETLYFGCLDGSITVVEFEKGELGDVVSDDVIGAQLTRYGADRESMIFPESVEQLVLEEKTIPGPKKKDPTPIQIASPVVSTPVVAKVATPIAPSKSDDHVKLRKQTVTITKSGKKRVAPLLVSASSAPPTNIQQQWQPPSKQQKHKISKVSQSNYLLPRLGLQTSVYGTKQRTTTAHAPQQEVEDDNDIDDIGDNAAANGTSGTTTVSDAALKRQKNRYKRRMMERRYPHSFKFVSTLPEMLFNNHMLVNGEINRIYKSYSKDLTSDISSGTAVEIDEDLLFSVVFSHVVHMQPSNDVLSQEEKVVSTSVEVRNGKPWKLEDDEFEYNDKVDFDDPTRVIVYDNTDATNRKFNLFFPYRIQHVLPILVGDELKYFVVASCQGTIQILSSTGRFVCPSFEIGETIISMMYRNTYLVILTSRGLFYSWNLESMKFQLTRVSIAPILNMVEITGESGDLRKPTSFVLPGVKCIDVDPRNGTPLVVLEQGWDVFGYNLDLKSWIKIIDGWYFSANEEDIEIKGNEDEYHTVLSRLVNKCKLAYTNEVQLQRAYAYELNESSELIQVMKQRQLQTITLALE
ncbi:uncharacterized protein SPAPADRAFT_66526 [Spathaspora passalidarum NRRL Y-27907]|uniref:Protein HIR n=1 Tax=Spathaspora passalidarum (strain NRRL Y-27907 / 11-Y1) TaxID=619300 RepID=G3AKC5_SPAPN|nr:uncharacterized protein SPAPADRAFT_66526 [Spathaspora passalidarum NRRL Y-27907]EGW33583.1 hypothetical protein SPAPADRAFT_66526 [Spathaspora passalidarum NRRL Y-27907]